MFFSLHLFAKTFFQKFFAYCLVVQDIWNLSYNCDTRVKLYCGYSCVAVYQGHACMTTWHTVTEFQHWSRNFPASLCRDEPSERQGN